jgi:hypothetical protein
MPCSFAGPIVVICDVAKLLTAGAFTLFGVPAIIWLAVDPSDVFGDVAAAALDEAVVDAVFVVVLVVVEVAAVEVVLVVVFVPAAPEPDTAEASDAGRPLSVATISGA